MEIDKQVVKVVSRVKQIQAAVRKKTTSLTRMKFLHQFEDIYGFHGYRKPDPSRSKHSRSTMMQSKNSSDPQESSHFLSSMQQRRTGNVATGKRANSLFDTDVSAFKNIDEVDEEKKSKFGSKAE